MLGSRNNRFHVMHRLMAMCGKDLPDNVAGRIAIEIRALGAQDRFLNCASTIGKPLSDFHPLIRDALTPQKPPPSDLDVEQ